MFHLFSHTKLSKQRGFTLLLAALVASIVLALGSSIFTIARKQVTLSSLGRDSQFAFYAADTIAECALYYDVRFNAFATSSASAQMGDVYCDKFLYIPDLIASDGNSATSRMTMALFTFDEDGVAQPGNCAEVTIIKSPTPPYTTIHADGYSLPCYQLTLNSRSLQRSIEIQY